MDQDVRTQFHQAGRELNPSYGTIGTLDPGRLEVSQEIGSGHARASDNDGKKCGPARAPHQAAWRLRTESGPHTAQYARLLRL